MNAKKTATPRTITFKEQSPTQFLLIQAIQEEGKKTRQTIWKVGGFLLIGIILSPFLVHFFINALPLFLFIFISILLAALTGKWIARTINKLREKKILRKINSHNNTNKKN